MFNKAVLFFSIGVFLFISPVYSEIVYLKNGGLLKGDVKKKTKEHITVKVVYGEIVISKKEVRKIEDNTDPKAILDLAKYYVANEEWTDAIEEFDNLLLVKPAMKTEVLKYVSDINFSKSTKQRMGRFKSVTEAYKTVEEGKMLINLGKKQLKYRARFSDKDWQKKVRSVARRQIKRGKALIKKGQAVIDAHHKARQAEIQKARDKAEQERKNSKK